MNLTAFKYVIQQFWKESQPMYFFLMKYFQYIHILKSKQNYKQILNPIEWAILVMESMQQFWNYFVLHSTE